MESQKTIEDPSCCDECEFYWSSECVCDHDDAIEHLPIGNPYERHPNCPLVPYICEGRR